MNDLRANAIRARVKAGTASALDLAEVLYVAALEKLALLREEKP
jgi:hypothetical protein